MTQEIQFLLNSMRRNGVLTSQQMQAIKREMIQNAKEKQEIIDAIKDDCFGAL